jgi:hypothetical protein
MNIMLLESFWYHDLRLEHPVKLFILFAVASTPTFGDFGIDLDMKRTISQKVLL